VYVRTTVQIDEQLLERATELTGIREKTALVRTALVALIAREAARRLAALYGSDPKLAMPRRRRSAE
jgi:Arc/MetJ family transcription regulator